MIGILGGTFDPIHNGHLRTALEVAEQLGVSTLRLIPAQVPPHRPQPVASAAHRYAMVQLAVACEPRLQADDCELRRSGTSYSVDTLAALRMAVGASCPLVFVLGQDAFQGFQTWRRWQDILGLAHLAVVQRPGHALPAAGWYAGHLAEAAALHRAPAGYICPLSVTALDISATAIRAQMRAGRSPRYLLPDAVLDYIQTHQLYRDT